MWWSPGTELFLLPKICTKLRVGHSSASKLPSHTPRKAEQNGLKAFRSHSRSIAVSHKRPLKGRTTGSRDLIQTASEENISPRIQYSTEMHPDRPKAEV